VIAPLPGIRRIAVLRANGLGDFVVAEPALAALRHAYPDARLTLIGRPWHVSLLAGRPGPWDEVVSAPPYPMLNAPADTPADSPEVRQFFDWALAQEFDLAVQLHGGGAASNPFVSKLGARVTVGARDHGAPPLHRSLPYTLYQHEVARWLEVVGLAGACPARLLPALHVTDADRMQARRWLPDPTMGSSPPVVIHPGASDPRRRWPPASFASVVGGLVADGRRVVLVGDGDDMRLAREILTHLDAATARRVTDLTGRLTLPALVGVCEAAGLVVANDSGPRHLAEAVGTPTVGVYWVGNVITASPLTRRWHRLAISFRSSCPVCGDDQSAGRCPHDESWVAEVPVAEVLSAARDLLVDVGDRREAASGSLPCG
jgi:ADP-heptose:LPS heptosyltransferase